YINKYVSGNRCKKYFSSLSFSYFSAKKDSSLTVEDAHFNCSGKSLFKKCCFSSFSVSGKGSTSSIFSFGSAGLFLEMNARHLEKIEGVSSSWSLSDSAFVFFAPKASHCSYCFFQFSCFNRIK